MNVYRAENGALVKTTQTDSNGFYSLSVPVREVYKIFFNPVYNAFAAEWWNDKTTIQTANTLFLTSNVTINVILASR